MNWEIVKSGFVAAWTAVAGVAGHKPANTPKPVSKPKPAKEVKAPASKPGQGKVVRAQNRAYLIERPSQMRFVGQPAPCPDSVGSVAKVRVVLIRTSATMTEDLQIYVRRS